MNALSTTAAAAVLLFLTLTVPGAKAARQGGIYEIPADSLDAGGGLSTGGSYSVAESLTSLGGLASGGNYQLFAGFAGVLGQGGTGAGPAAFASWQTVFFGSPSEPGAGAMDDPDGDGISNLLEFAFNLPPLTAGTPSAGPGTTGGLPLIRVEDFDGLRYFTMEYIVRKNAGLFLPESTSSLDAWSSAPSVILEGPVPVSGAYEKFKIRLGSPVETGAPQFYRLRVVIQ